MIKLFTQFILLFFQKNTMMKTDKENLRQMINLALKNEMSWISLAFFCHDLTPDPVKAKLVVEVLLEELQILQNKECKCISNENERIELPSKCVDSQPTSDDFTENENVTENKDDSNQDTFMKSESIQENLHSSKDQYQHFEVETFNETENVRENGDESTNEPFLKFEAIQEDIHSEIKDTNDETFESTGIKQYILQNKAPEHDQAKEYSIDDHPSEFHSKQGVKHQCKTCQSSFKSNWYLKVHETIHSGEKPSKCRFCPRIFIIHDNLRNHEERHTKLLLFRRKFLGCNTCNKTFKDAKSLQIHKNTHTKK